MRCSGLVIALSVLLAACSTPPAEAPPVDRASDEQAIRDADARWLQAARAGDSAAEAAMFADDGVAYREHVDPLVGPTAIQQYFAKLRADNPMQEVDWTTSDVHVSDSGDLAVQTGEYRLKGLGPKGDRDDRGRFVTVWKKVDGEWKVAHDIGSTTMPEVTAPGS